MPPTRRTVPLTRALGVENAGARPLEILEHALAEAEQRGAGRRDADLAAEPEEQLLLQLLFEQQDLAADGRLRQVQLLPGARERAGLRDRAQYLQLSQVHASPPCTAAILSSCAAGRQWPFSNAVSSNHDFFVGFTESAAARVRRTIAAIHREFSARCGADTGSSRRWTRACCLIGASRAHFGACDAGARR